MQIEQAIRELSTAIDNLSLAIKGSRNVALSTAPATYEGEPMTVTTAPAPKVQAEPAEQGVTEADLRAAAQRLLQAKRLPDILRINKEFGIRRITECPPDRHAALLDALNAALSDASGS